MGREQQAREGRLALLVLVSPAPHASTIWALCTIERGSDREWARACNCGTSSSLWNSGGIGRSSPTGHFSDTLNFSSCLRAVY